MQGIKSTIRPGETYHKLTVLNVLPGAGKGPRVECRCACGNTSEHFAYQLLSGMAKSCGCLRAENAERQFKKHGQAQSTEKKASPEYMTWARMWDRCTNPQNKRYARYGGRGVIVCVAWKDFATFVSDMGQRPPKCSLDRIDNDGDYTPENCRWGTATQQVRNRRNTVRLSHNGKVQTVQEWADETGLPYGTIIRRFYRGWAHDRILASVHR